jgi:hypothetical protein
MALSIVVRNWISTILDQNQMKTNSEKFLWTNHSKSIEQSM